MGYGFVLEDNEDDTVSFSANTHTSPSRLADELALGMKKDNPAVALATNASSAEPSTSTGQQTSARRDSSSYAIPIEKLAIFSETRALRVIVPGEWKTQFNDVLRGALSLTQAHDLAMQLANKRELKALRESNIMTDFLPLMPTRNVCLIADRTILALRNYRGRLQRDMPKENPTNHRQWMAATFWQGQAKIVGGNIELLEKFLLGLQKDGYIITLQQILTNVNVSPDAIRLPLRAILEGGCQIKPKARHVMENSLLEFAFVVWFGLLWFHQGVSGPGQSSSGAIELTEVLKDWVEFVKKQYGEELRYDVAGYLNPLSPETLQQASNSGRTQRYLEIIQRFAADETQALAPVFQNSFWNRGILTAAIAVFCEESIAFESMDRLIFNGAEEVDEPFLFLERCD